MKIFKGNNFRFVPNVYHLFLDQQICKDTGKIDFFRHFNKEPPKREIMVMDLLGKTLDQGNFSE